MWAALLVLFLAYLFGSIPAGVVVARTYGVDIRKVGSGNIGATNVLRALGWGPALVVAFFDVFKGGIAVLIARALGLADWLLGGVALMAVLGHNYSVFLGFKGGKGVATSFGTLLFLDPVLALWTFPGCLTSWSSLPTPTTGSWGVGGRWPGPRRRGFPRGFWT
jgi:glycerol-3-phosphate acyltransferase PlsY